MDRIRREKLTVDKMINLYCRAYHKTDKDCHECHDLRQYAFSKLDTCPFGIKKPICANCKLHCYNNPMRKKIRDVMRYAGPRMIFHHPFLALMHVLDKWRGKSDM